MIFNAVIFDLDDTLYDYDVAHNKAIEVVANKLEIDPIEFNSMYRKISDRLKTQLGLIASSHNRFICFKHLNEEHNLDYDITEIDNLYWKTYFDNMFLFKGVFDLLKFLKDEGIKICLLTDFLMEYQYLKLKQLKILEFFNIIVTSEEVGIDKPSISMFQYCLNKLNEPSDKVIMIGDNISKDIEGAKNAGIYPFWFKKYSNNPHIGNMLLSFGKDKASFSYYTELLEYFILLKKDLYYLNQLSVYCGERFDLTQAAGGNVSVKNDKLMMIKSSGQILSNVSNKTGFTTLNNVNLNKGLKNDVINNIYNNIENYNIINKKKASMEAYMHSFLGKYVIHVHPIQVNRILVRKDAEEIIKELFPDSIFIDYVEPGIELSKKILENIEPCIVTENRTYDSKVIFLANHGLIVSCDNETSVMCILEEILTKCEKYNNLDFYKYKNVNLISNMMRWAFEGQGKRFVSYYCDDKIINDFFRLCDYKTVFPDKVIYCGTAFIEMVYYKDKKFGFADWYKIHKYNPTIFVAEDSIYISSSSLEKCREIESVLKSHLMILTNNSNINYLTEQEENNLLNMDAEKYRQNVHSA